MKVWEWEGKRPQARYLDHNETEKTLPKPLPSRWNVWEWEAKVVTCVALGFALGFLTALLLGVMGQ